MLQKILFSCLILSMFATIGVFLLKNSKSNQIIEKMPLVQDDPFAYLAKGSMPIEERDPKFNKWLSVGVKIRVPKASGSGTIIYYNQNDGYAYVQSCGHLWSGSMNAEQCAARKITCNIIVWYNNEIKLAAPKTYVAEVLYYSNNTGRDCSLLRFVPDWNPEFLPIAPEDYEFVPNARFHSVGCDGGSEVARYEVVYLGNRGTQWPDIITTGNSPRPGRSGGGLMSDEYYVGICWGTTEFDGSGNGFFTPLKTIREYNSLNGFGWLNDAGYSLAREIPIIDKNNPQRKYPKDYIPLPHGR